jgi:hypothetical protein
MPENLRTNNWRHCDFSNLVGNNEINATPGKFRVESGASLVWQTYLLPFCNR